MLEAKFSDNPFILSGKWLCTRVNITRISYLFKEKLDIYKIEIVLT